MTDELSTPSLTKFAEIVGFEVTKFGDGRCTVEATVDERHLNLSGVAHGGLHATMLDTSMGGALVSTLPKEEWCATAQIDISYLNAAPLGSHLTANGSVVRRGRNLAHLEGELASEDGTVIATAKGTWAIWRKRPSSLGGS